MPLFWMFSNMILLVMVMVLVILYSNNYFLLKNKMMSHGTKFLYWCW